MLSDWYKVVRKNSTLEQGDFLFELPALEVQEDYEYSDEQEVNPPAKFVSRDMVIISQSCDLEDENIDYVQLCPVHSLESLVMFRSNAKRGELSSDRMPRFALLDKNGRQGFPKDFFVVDLASVQSLPLEYVKRFASGKKRLRLISPYREYLSQKFAYLFMRVGKPTSVKLPKVTP